MDSSDNSLPASLLNSLRLKKLTMEQVEQIDKFLASVGEYGEVHLIVQRGELKYVNKMESHKAWKDEDDD